MSEYEIFNSDADEQDVVQERKEKKEKIKTKRDCKCKAFLSKAFSFEHLSLSLAIISLVLTIFTKLLPLSGTVGGIVATCVFFVCSVCCAIAGLIIEIVKMAKEKNFFFSVHLAVVLVAIVIASISI